MEMPTWLAALELLAIFATAMSGAFAAVKAAKLDLLGVLTLGIITALGGGVVRDVLIGVTPPVAFTNLAYLAAAGLGALGPMFLFQPGKTLGRAVNAVDAIGLGLYSVVGAQKALLFGLGPLPAIIVGAISGVGGGIIRDIAVNRVPAVLHKDFYAIPGIVAASVVVVAHALGFHSALGPALIGTALCFALWLGGIVFKVQIPRPRYARETPDGG